MTTNPTTPTPTTAKPREPWIELAQDAEGWHWCLWSGNGQAVARNAVPYTDKKHAIQAIRLLGKVFEQAKIICMSHAG